MKQKFELLVEIEKTPVRIERIGDVLRVMEGDYILAMIQIDKGQGAVVKIEGFQVFKAALPESFNKVTFPENFK